MSEENTQDKINHKATNTKDTQTVFSPEEVEATVKEFINAYVRGQIKIRLYMPTYSDTSTNYTVLPQRERDEYAKALGVREFMKDLILIVTGNKKSTKEQYKSAISRLFEQILILRLTDTIDGQFNVIDVEGKLLSLEQKYDKLSKSYQSIDKLVKQIVDYVERIDPFKGKQ